jgi:cobalt/nickel transport protein
MEYFMKRRLHGFVLVGLGISLLAVLFLSPLASTYPDGLEKAAQVHGFAQKGEAFKVWTFAPFPDYALPWVKNERVSAAISGIAGTLAIFFLSWGIARLLKKSPNQ